MPAGAAPARSQTANVQPLKAPPYLASQTAKRAYVPDPEPWAHSLKLLMIVFGATLMGCFVAPWAFDPKMIFSWTGLPDAKLYGKIVPLMIAGTGALAVVLALLPLTTLARGVGALALGALPFIYYSIGHGGKVPWQALVLIVGLLAVTGGLIVRSQYKSSMAARVVVTVGAIAVMLPYLIPEGGGKPPLIQFFDLLADADGKGKLVVILVLLPFVLGVFSLLSWLPASSPSGPALVLAWIWISLPLIAWVSFAPTSGKEPPVSGVLVHLIADTDNFASMLKSTTGAVLWKPLATMAWLAIAGYGLATVIGKQIET